MQIVRIFPNNKHKCHFSIRKHNNKFFVYEGDKVLRTELPSVNSAETEISLIVLNRKKSGATEIPVKYGEATINHKIENEMPEPKQPRNHTLTPKNCSICEVEFMSKRSNHLTCSRECSIKFQAKKKALKRQIESPISFVQKESERESFEKGILDAYDNMRIVEPTKEDLNEFHEFTEKQMRLSERKKKIGQMVGIFVDYAVTWCAVNQSFQHPQSYHSLFQELVNYKIFDLSKNQLISAFDPFFEVQFGTLNLKSNTNFLDVTSIVKVKEKLIELIYEENLIPNDEQIAKSSILRLMLSQLNFIRKQQIDVYKLTKGGKSNDTIDAEIFSGILDMINNLANQNKIIGDRLNQTLEQQNAIWTLQNQNYAEVGKDLFDLRTCIDKLTSQVIEITKKRRGLFG
jgi:hypothetical protein